jgi:membrane protein YqaA with SNARE-associated domain
VAASAPALAALPALLDIAGLEEAVRTATGPFGLVIIWVYSFLIAFVLPLPSEVVLVPDLRLGLPRWLELAAVIGVSAFGKAVGSVFAFTIGHGVKRAGPVVRALRRAPVDVVGWSQRRTVELAKQYGYAGMAAALCVPGFPDTLSIYAFSVLEEDYLRFALAAFVGSVGRLLLTLGVVGGGMRLLGL